MAQGTDDDTVQYEPRLDSGDLPASGDEQHLAPDLAMPTLRGSGSDDSDVQTVPFEPQLALPDHRLSVRACASNTLPLGLPALTTGKHAHKPCSKQHR